MRGNLLGLGLVNYGLFVFVYEVLLGYSYLYLFKCWLGLFLGCNSRVK